MDRRTFLRPGSMAQIVSQADPTAPPATQPSPPESAQDGPPRLLRYSQKAMGTHFEWVFPFGVEDSSHLANQAFALVERLEELLSVYQNTSEVCRLTEQGQRAGGCRVSQPLWDLVSQSRLLSQLTEGAFDPAYGKLVRSWGFVRGPFRVPPQEEIDQILSEGGMGRVVLDERTKQICHLSPGVEWNFGAIGKGYAIDWVVKWLESRPSMGSFLLHSGRSSIYAKGRSPAEESGWVVQVNHPISQGAMANVRLSNEALATSAATFRHFEFEGKTYGHVLDPRKGYPSEELLSATVVAPQSAVADALSTAVFVAGVDLAEHLCQQDPNLGFLLLEKGDDRPPRLLGKMKDMVLEN